MPLSTYTRLLISLILLTAFALSSLVGFITIREVADSSESQMYAAISNLFAENVRNDVLTGNHSAVRFACDKLRKEAYVFSVSVNSSGEELCDSVLSGTILSRKLSFDKNGLDVAATVFIAFSSDLSTSIYSEAMTALGLFFALSMVAVFFFSQIFDRSFQNLSKAKSILLEKKIEAGPELRKLQGNNIVEVQALVRGLADFSDQLKRAQKEVMEAQTSHAIASTVQMVAHDVRKPFSLLASGIQIFKGAKSMNEIQKMLPHLESSLNSALTSVNGMLSDIMDVGRDLELEIEPSSIKGLVHQALEETSYVFSEARVPVSYQWAHTHLLKVDPMKMQRVLSNILSNACQAMRARQPIWICTSEKAGKFEIVIGNHGSSISEEDLPKLFQVFFTKRERGKGTGLGLAIAKKIVEAHGGTIEACSDTEKNQAEFIISLPSDSKEDHLKNQQLPSTLAGFSMLRSMTKRPVDDLGNNTDRINRKEQLKKHVKEIGRRLSIAILDDEEFYRTIVVKLSEHHELTALLTFLQFAHSDEILRADLEAIDFIISDVDLNDDLNGYQVTERIRSLKLDIPICIHSNKALSQDYKKAIRSGATTFMPKPMTIDHLLRFLTDCLDIKNGSNQS